MYCYFLPTNSGHNYKLFKLNKICFNIYIQDTNDWNSLPNHAATLYDFKIVADY